MSLKSIAALVAFPMLVCTVQVKGTCSSVLTTLRGRVTTQLGDLLPGAQVHVHNIDPRPGKVTLNPLATGMTDEKGEFAIDLMAPGPYLVIVEAMGFKSVGFWKWNQFSEVLDVALPVGQLFPMDFSVEGHIRSPDGQGIEDCSVSLIGVLNPQVFYQVRTDRDGRFEIHSRSSGTFIVVGSRPGFSVTIETVDLRRNGERKKVDLELKPEPDSP